MHKLPNLHFFTKGGKISLPTETLLLPLLSSSRPTSVQLLSFKISYIYLHTSCHYFPLCMRGSRAYSLLRHWIKGALPGNGRFACVYFQPSFFWNVLYISIILSPISWCRLIVYELGHLPPFRSGGELELNIASSVAFGRGLSYKVFILLQIGLESSWDKLEI